MESVGARVGVSGRGGAAREVQRVELADVLAVERAVDVEGLSVLRVDEARVGRAHLDVRVGERALELGAERERDVAVLEDARLRELLGHVDARGLLRGGAGALLLDRDDPQPGALDLLRGVPDSRVRVGAAVHLVGDRGLRDREVERDIEQLVRVGARGDRVPRRLGVTFLRRRRAARSRGEREESEDREGVERGEGAAHDEHSYIHVLFHHPAGAPRNGSMELRVLASSSMIHPGQNFPTISGRLRFWP